MNAREIAEQIARDTSCAQGEFQQRVLAILPYLTPAADEIERLTERCAMYKGQVEAGANEIERLRERNATLEAAHRQTLATLDRQAAENERLRPALGPLAKYADNFDAHEYGDPARPKLFPDHHHTAGANGPMIGELRAARTAYQQTLTTESGK